MKRTICLWMCLAAVAGAADAAQSPADAAATMVRAAGMPLADGELAPGMLTVRVVKGAFEGDLPGVDVIADLSGGERLRAQTGARGRAVFAQVPIGRMVKVSATVGGERLESEPFQLPDTSGVRILLVTAGGGAVLAPAIADATTAAAQPSMPAASPEASPSLPIAAVFAGATLLFATSIVWQSRTRTRKGDAHR
jgi:hypothetical protein